MRGKIYHIQEFIDEANNFSTCLANYNHVLTITDHATVVNIYVILTFEFVLASSL